MTTGGSFTLAYDSATNHSSLDTPVVTVPELGLAFLILVPLVPYLMAAIWRRRRLAGSLASLFVGAILAISLAANQVMPVSAAPDTFYLHNTATSGISPAGRYMNTTEGSAGSTMTFNTVSQNAYWYVDQTWPTGSGNGGIAAGNYTLNMYFNRLPLYARTVTTGEAVAGATTMTISHTVAGTNRVMVVGVSMNNDSLETVSSVTWNGTALSFAGAQVNPDGDDARIEMWGLLAPATGGPYNVVVTFSAALSTHAYAGVVTFNGVHQTTPSGAFASASGDGTSPATVPVPSAVGDLVFGVVASEYSTLTVGAGQTSLWNLYHSGTSSGGAGSTEPGAAGSVTTSWDLPTVSGNHWAIGGISLKPSASSVSITVYVHHTRADGTDPQLITSASTTIDSSTADPLALSLGSGALQTFTSADPRQLRVQISVTAVSGSGSFVLDYNGSCATSRCSSLDTPVVTVPEGAVALVAVGVLIPMVTASAWRRRRLAQRLRMANSPSSRARPARGRAPPSGCALDDSGNGAHSHPLA